MKFPKTLLLTTVIMAVTFVVTGCAKKLSPEPFDPNLRLTAGQVKMTIEKGETRQSDVFNALGVPNVIGLQSEGGEIWTYDQMKVRRSAQGYTAGAFFGTLFAFSKISKNSIGTGGGGADVSVGASLDNSTSAVQTATLIIRFDADEKVESYQMLITSF